jgi:hypothetical protein
VVLPGFAAAAMMLYLGLAYITDHPLLAAARTASCALVVRWVVGALLTLI